MAEVDLAAALTTFTRSAWRLLALDHYTSPGEAAALESWRRGGQPRNEDWIALLERHRAAGRPVGRVHAISVPPTDYVNFVLAAYRANAAAGEEIGITNRADHPELDEDFWIFDDRRVALMKYDEAGRFTGAVDATHRIDHYRALRDAALHVATPLSEWTHAVA